MKNDTLLKIAGKSILKNKMRTLLTMLGVIIGVGAVSVLAAVGTGAKSQIQAQIQNLGTNLIVITPGSTSQGGVSQGAQSFNRLSLDDVEALEGQSFLLAGVSPIITSRAQIVGGAGNWVTSADGVDVDYTAIRDWPLTSGSFFGGDDLASNRKVVVLGSTVSEALFPYEDPVGREIRIRDVPFTVIGVLAPKGQTASGRDLDDVVLVPFTTAQTRLSGRQFIPQILASTYNPEDIPGAQEEIRGILRDAHGLARNEADDFEVRNQSELTDTASETARIMTLLLSAIAGISLVVGGIGIMIGYGADPGDRPSAGPGGPGVRRPHPVPGGGGGHEPGRGGGGGGAGVCGQRDRESRHGLEHHDLPTDRAPGPGVRRWGRGVLRVLSGPAGGGTGSHRGAPVRVTEGLAMVGMWTEYSGWVGDVGRRGQGITEGHRRRAPGKRKPRGPGD